MNWRATFLLACWMPWAAQAATQGTHTDPVPSVMWDFYHKQLLGQAAFVFDDRVKLLAPPFAEDARQVPLEIDARAFTGDGADYRLGRAEPSAAHRRLSAR